MRRLTAELNFIDSETVRQANLEVTRKRLLSVKLYETTVLENLSAIEDYETELLTADIDNFIPRSAD